VALEASLRATKTVQVDLADVWRLWAASAPRLVGAHSQAALLREALDALAAAGSVELPIGSWDTSTAPALPSWVRVPANRRLRRADPWRQFPWCSELGWVASLVHLSDRGFQELVAVHRWLVDHRDPPLVPVRYRSVELFGNEKRLDDLVRSQLFAPGRLSLDILRCHRLPPPLPAIPVGEGTDVLVLENSDPYWVAADVLRSTDSHPIRAVAWGSGTAFPAQVETLGVDIAGQGPVTGVVWYWGDLDPAGVRIGADAAAASSALDGVPVVPAHGLWNAMTSCELQDTGTITWPEPAPGAEWIGPALWQRLAPIRTANARVAQEAVPPSAIASWARSLTPS
jgi:hypothetical protein